MPTVKIPLVGSYNERGLAGSAALVASEDQRFLNAVFDVVTNPVTGKSSVYLSKRPGLAVDSLVTAGNASTGMLRTQSFNSTIAAFGASDSTIYLGTISVGTITGRAQHFTETLISSVGYVCIKSSDGTGWYYVDGAKDQLAYTGDTHTNNIIDNIASTAGMYIGQALSGSGLAVGTRITAITSATAITVSPVTTATASGVALTKTPIAKILDTDFVASAVYVSAFVAMDGYLFYSTDDGNLRNSDLNSVTSYTSTSTLPVQMSPDKPVGVAVQNNAVVTFGLGSKEVAQNAGLSSGSPLQRVASAFQRIGCLDQRSLTQIEDDIYFVSTPFEGDIGVYRMRNLAASRVSTPAVDRIIGTFGSNGAIYASSFKLGGQSYAAFVLSTAFDGPDSYLLLESGDNILLESGDDIVLEDTPASVASYVGTMVYNSGINLWSEWDCNQATFIDGVSTGSANQLVATSRFNTGGEVYTINPTSDGQLYQDDGSAILTQVRTARIDHGTPSRKVIPKIRLIGDRQETGTATLEANDHDYDPTKWFTLGTFDLTKMKPQITRCGSYEGGRAYRLSHSDNAPFRAEALEIEYQECA